MADLTQTIALNGFRKTDPSSVTVLVDGVEVFSGAVADLDDVTQGTLCSWTYTQADSVTAITDHTLSIACTSGYIQSGPIWVGIGPTDSLPINTSVTPNVPWYEGNDQLEADPDGNYYYIPGAGCEGTYGDATERTNILINGVAPAYPSAGIKPTGTEADPTWGGWCFDLAAGETLTCTLRIPPALISNASARADQQDGNPDNPPKPA